MLAPVLVSAVPVLALLAPLSLALWLALDWVLELQEPALVLV